MKRDLRGVASPSGGTLSSSSSGAGSSAPFPYFAARASTRQFSPSNLDHTSVSSRIVRHVEEKSGWWDHGEGVPRASGRKSNVLNESTVSS